MALQPDLSREAACGATPVCGIDEVGRGPWAGPLVAAAAILDPLPQVEGIADSKTLPKPARERIAAALHRSVPVGLGIVEVAELDEIGLTAANDLAMIRALDALPIRPRHALVDGRRLPPGLPVPGQALVRGDATSLSIAAASILAKVCRDRLMAELAGAWPGYGWETNAGYGTAAHRRGLETLGVTPHHRRSFKPIAEILLKEQRIES